MKKTVQNQKKRIRDQTLQVATAAHRAESLQSRHNSLVSQIDRSKEHTRKLGDAIVRHKTEAQQSELKAKQLRAENKRLRKQLNEAKMSVEIKDLQAELNLLRGNGELRRLTVDQLQELVGTHQNAIKAINTEMVRRLNRREHENHTNCRICFDAPVNVGFRPCQHCVCCSNCAKKLTKCPICRKTIQARFKVFV